MLSYMGDIGQSLENRSVDGNADWDDAQEASTKHYNGCKISGGVHCTLEASWCALCLCLEILPMWQKNFNAVYLWEGGLVNTESFWTDLCWKSRAKSQQANLKHLARWKAPLELCIIRIKQRRESCLSSEGNSVFEMQEIPWDTF